MSSQSNSFWMLDLCDVAVSVGDAGIRAEFVMSWAALGTCGNGAHGGSGIMESKGIDRFLSESGIVYKSSSARFLFESSVMCFAHLVYSLICSANTTVRLNSPGKHQVLSLNVATSDSIVLASSQNVSPW